MAGEAGYSAGTARTGLMGGPAGIYAPIIGAKILLAADSDAACEGLERLAGDSWLLSMAGHEVRGGHPAGSARPGAQVPGQRGLIAQNRALVTAAARTFITSVAEAVTRDATRDAVTRGATSGRPRSTASAALSWLSELPGALPDPCLGYVPFRSSPARTAAWLMSTALVAVSNVSGPLAAMSRTWSRACRGPSSASSAV